MPRKGAERDPRVIPVNATLVHTVQSNPNSDYLKLPEISDVQRNLDLLDTEIYRLFKNLDRDTIKSFFIPFLGFLIKVAAHIQFEMSIFESKYRESLVIPKEISENWESSWEFDDITVRSYYKKLDNLNNVELEVKDFLEAKLWYSFFVGYLRGTVDTALAFLVLFESDEINWTRATRETFLHVMDSTPPEKVQESVREVVEHDINNFYVQPYQWNQVVFVQFAKYLTLASNKKYWRGKTPFFLYIDTPDFPDQLAKIFNGKSWASGFHHRVIVPNLAGLSPAQVAEMWDYLLVKRKIYEDTSIDHAVRGEVFELVKERLVKIEGSHVDLCGGMGHFILWLREQGVDVQSTLIDIAPKAVKHAKKKKIEAYVGNANLRIDIDKKFDVLTIMFAIQWLDANAYANIIHLLNPGGTLICNIYPAYEEVAQYYVGLLSAQGFVDVEYKQYPTNRGKNNYILSAKRPIELQ